MQATTQLSEKELLEILRKHFAEHGVTLKSIRIGREDYGGDPREVPHGYVECSMDIDLLKR